MSNNHIKSVTGKDVFERINYLYQLSCITFKSNENNVASSLYSNLLMNISKKAVQRLEPNIKRSICKKCHNLLIPGVSATIRIRKKNVKWTCKRCHSTKVFKAVPGYQLWIDNKEAIVETVQF
ncbi:hypothetical protein RN001_001267 [Aquatica leii]|uniref:Uncharacterized protein n=1 Tax=Aquatica leii TaxID=1421715 RepID=A0AAN7PL17_9COLE|nr:hypothetical protein RN001_001267 [Aquatica leii]